MIQQYCTVCGALLEEPHEFESRTYCDTHYNRFSLDVPGVWRAVSVSVLTLFVQSVAIALLALVLPPLESGPLRLGFGLIVATFPAAVWLIVMLQTTQSNRVSSLLVTIFVLAALAAAAFTRPFLNEFIGLAEWLTRTTVIYRFLGNILVAGMTHAFLVFAIIRFTVWMNPVFERRVDGVMYGAAAGWGYATAINILFVLDQGGVALLNGGLRVVSQACPYVAMGLIVGYILGRTRFEEMAFYYLGIGVAAGAIVNGLLLYAGTELNTIRLNLTTDGFSPWPGLIANLLILTLASAAVFGLQRRHNRLTRARLRLEDA